MYQKTSGNGPAWPHVAKFGAPKVDQERLVVGPVSNLHLIIDHVVPRNIVVRYPRLHMQVDKRVEDLYRMGKAAGGHLAAII